MHLQGEKGKNKKKRGKGKGGKGRKGGDAKYCNFVGPAFYSCIFLGERACSLTTLSFKKFKTNMPIVYMPSSFKYLRGRWAGGEREHPLFPKT